MIKHPLEHYNYEISDINIGKTPAEPRDQAKLFVYNTSEDKIYIDQFYNLHNYLPENSLLVMNNTGVIPARVVFTKDTGGKVEGLFLFNEGIQEDGTIPIIVMKQILIGRKLFIDQYEFTVVRQNNQYFYIKPEFDANELPSIMMKYGTTPTPRYLGKLEMREENVRERYQTIFAHEKKSVAAPTASLHFTQGVFKSLADKKISRAEVTLHVGMGTFAEVSESNIESKTLHTEPISISHETKTKVQNAKQRNQPIIAVGTTAIRTLESQAAYLLEENQHDLNTSTNIFIMPGYEFNIADILITNFHVPKSSLMALVDAFLQHKKAKKSILELYKIALDNEFKFYSFGDSMVVV